MITEKEVFYLLKRTYLSKQQYRTIKGQVLAGDIEGAYKGLLKLRRRNGQDHYRNEADASRQAGAVRK